MCIGVISICGYGVQISNICHFLDPERILAYLQSAACADLAVTVGEGWMASFNSTYREQKLKMLEDLGGPGKEIIAEAIASASASAGVAVLSNYDFGGTIIHLPKYPWSRSMIDLSESETTICDAVAPFLLPGVERDAIRELIDYFEGAEESEEVLM